MLVNGLEPAQRPGQEGEGRERDQRDTVIQAAQPGADQAHVVVERQPAHAHVLRPAGTALIAGKRYDVLADGGVWLAAGSALCVSAIRDGHVIVRDTAAAP